jgi:hypothetical protein
MRRYGILAFVLALSGCAHEPLPFGGTQQSVSEIDPQELRDLNVGVRDAIAAKLHNTVSVEVVIQELKNSPSLANFFIRYGFAHRSGDSYVFSQKYGYACGGDYCRGYPVASASFVKVLELWRNDTGEATTGRKIDFIFRSEPLPGLGQFFLSKKVLTCSAASKTDSDLWTHAGMLGTGFAVANEYGPVIVSKISLDCPSGFRDSKF